MMSVQEQTSDVLRLAMATFPRFEPIAMQLATDRKSTILGGVATQIFIANGNLEIHHENETLEAILIILSSFYPLGWVRE